MLHASTHQPRHDGQEGRGGGGVAAGKLGDEVDFRFPTSPHGYKGAVASQLAVCVGVVCVGVV